MTANVKKSNIQLPTTSWIPDGNIEGVSNTIIQRVAGGPLIKTDALTSDGWLRTLGIECDETIREQVIEQMSLMMSWKVARPTTFVVPGSIPRTAPTPPDWIDDQSGILARIESEKVGSDEFEKAILISEITDFADDTIERLLGALSVFISDHRFATDEDTIILLGCAIRKYALNMAPNQLEGYVDWLSTGEAKTIHNRVELELVKGVLWRLSYEPFKATGKFPKTLLVLHDIANVYLNRRLIFQESNVSIATQAVAALFVLSVISDDGAKIASTMKQVKDLERDWIAEVVEDNILEATDAISEYDLPLSKKLAASFDDAKKDLF